MPTETTAILLWLDDVRNPEDYYPGEGWLWVKTVEEAKELLKSGNVLDASLDHDLGACETCLDGLSYEQWLEKAHFKNAPNCHHVGTGYDLCLWMAEYGIWPKHMPTVHSANPVGRKNMRGVIERYYTAPETA